MPACTSCGNENPEQARFCFACGAPLGPPGAPHEVRKLVTVVFSDLVGSTTIGEQLDPESLRRLLTRYFEEMKAVLERHGATVREFLGDAVMAVFGTPVVHEDDALRAVRAASEMRERLEVLNDELERTWGVRLAARTGLNTGEVVAGDAAASQTLVLGDAVNLAARLEQAAEPGEILLGEATFRLVRDAVRAEPVEPLSVKGKGELVSAFRLLDVVPHAPGLARRLETPLVGRSRELRLLREAFERAAEERTSHLFTVLGEVGIGKSRLANELATSVQDKATVLVGRCLSYGEGITYWPLAEMVRQVAGDDASTGLARLLEGTDDGVLVAERVAAAVGLVDGAAAAGAETFWAVRKLFEVLASERPLVLVFEDIHWAEPTLLDLIEYLAEWVREAPVVIYCLARPELFEGRSTWGGGKLNAASMLLEPLSEADVERLIEDLVGETQLASEIRVRIAKASEGNPLFLEQMLALIAEGDTETTSLAIQSLLVARLDRLGSAERTLIECASIEGETFHTGGLFALAPELSRAEAERHLMALVRKELLRPERATLPGEDALRFRHGLIREAAYETLPKETRADLHERLADWLEVSAGRRIGEYEEIIGYHLERACRYHAELGASGERSEGLAERAGERLAAAGQRAFRRGDMPAAVNLLERARSLLAEKTQSRLELAPDLSFALFQTGRLKDVDGLLDETIGSARALGASAIEWQAIVLRSYWQMFSDPESVDLERLRGEAEQAIEVFEKLGDDLGLSRAWTLLWDVRGYSFEAGLLEEAAERGLEHARRAGSRQDEAWVLGNFGWALLDGPAPAARALGRFEELILSAQGDRAVEGFVLAFCSVSEAMLGRFDDAREHLQRARSLLEDFGLTYQLGTARLMAGRLELLAGDPAAAEREIKLARDAFQRMGDNWFAAISAADLVHALLEQGRNEEAFRLLPTLAGSSGIRDPEFQVKHSWVRAEALARHGGAVEAEAAARHAVGLVEGTGFLNFYGDAQMALAEVLRIGGRSEEAARAAVQAIQAYERKGNVASAGKARASLGAGGLAALGGTLGRLS